MQTLTSTQSQKTNSNYRALTEYEGSCVTENKRTAAVWCRLTMSISVSAFFTLGLRPFMTGLEGSLSDSTMTSSGVGGLSFLISLREREEERKTLTSNHCCVDHYCVMKARARSPSNEHFCSCTANCNQG